jgi:hypothetical protein
MEKIYIHRALKKGVGSEEKKAHNGAQISKEDREKWAIFNHV